MAKLTIFHGKANPIVATGKNQCNLLSFAYNFQGWHTFKQDSATKKAITALQSKGCLEVIGDQFRFCYPS